MMPMRRRGVALLIVLAALIMTATATALLATQAATIQAQRRIDRCSRLADDVLRAADGPIGHWLAHDADGIVLSADSQSPRVALLRDRWTLSSSECELAISAFDQCGMVPLDIARSGSPLRLAVSGDVLHIIDALPDEDADERFGLDALVDLEEPRASSPFPQQAQAEPITFGPMSPSTPSAVPAHLPNDKLHVGELVATHNRSPMKININTAPMSLVKAAVRAARRGDSELIAQARRLGKPALVPDHIDSASPDGQPRAFAPEIIARSDCWAFRIDIRLGPVQRSWWAVYQRGEGSSDGTGQSVSFLGGWRCLQRVAICD